MKGYPSSISLNNEYVFVPMCKLLIEKKNATIQYIQTIKLNVSHLESFSIQSTPYLYFVRMYFGLRMISGHSVASQTSFLAGTPTHVFPGSRSHLS